MGYGIPEAGDSWCYKGPNYYKQDCDITREGETIQEEQKLKLENENEQLKNENEQLKNELTTLSYMVVFP